jgi:hypothetical protein
MKTDLILSVAKFSFELYKELKKSPLTKEDIEKQKKTMIKKIKKVAIEYNNAKNNNNNI